MDFDSEIIKNAREIGMEKYISKIEKLIKTNFTKSKPKLNKKEKASKKIIKVRLGPNNVHTILDSLEIEHWKFKRELWAKAMAKIGQFI